MGISGVGVWQILIVLMLGVLLFGSGKIRRMGEDLGGAISGFRRSSRQGDRESFEVSAKEELPDGFIQPGERR
ncbi:twin-arginine translocase TatA/TatE family subunit [Microbulbifer sp. OS29]|uniref:Sec-independent protein translocase protein TatA n=1 Tax=Microbulbifer okhotskensis TaxID=2926617 RepID=A0A9X2ESL2_9GAMM|nr:twin-arginine translocase TatA/TatE family subunit [Microbulbifer okhotskensis]MCO1334986.1 twin-arginine translocase TatA/TatE family subunit [Microbulbifer okhotskensis]